VEIKIEAKTVVANEGGFEPHPESYTPRVFAAVWERGAKVYEILQNGQAIPWPCLPILEGFDYWVLYVEHLSDIDMHRAPKKAGFGPSTQKAIDNAQAAHRYQQDPVPQAAFRAPNPRRVTSEELDRIIKEYGRPYMLSGDNIVPYVSPLYQVGNDYYYTYDDLHPASQDSVPQADGYSGTLPEDVTWIGEIDGKRYSGLGKPESGPLSHLPEGSH
jgi:hypothetical protein